MRFEPGDGRRIVAQASCLRNGEGLAGDGQRAGPRACARVSCYEVVYRPIPATAGA